MMWALRSPCNNLSSSCYGIPKCFFARLHDFDFDVDYQLPGMAFPWAEGDVRQLFIWIWWFHVPVLVEYVEACCSCLLGGNAVGVSDSCTLISNTWLVSHDAIDGTLNEQIWA